jgi:Mg-chelatase subunit ChlD
MEEYASFTFNRRTFLIGAMSSALALSYSGCKRNQDYDLPEVPKTLEERTQYANVKSIAIILDTSTSMDERINGTSKLVSAKRSIKTLLDKCEEHKTEMVINAGLLYFSGFGNVKLASPIESFEYNRLYNSLQRLSTHGSTPLGLGLITAKRELDKTKAGEEYIVLLTDGENTSGEDPLEMLRKINKTDEERHDPKTKVYIVPFGMKEKVHNRLASDGAIVIPADNEEELLNQFRYIGKRIFAEKPE